MAEPEPLVVQAGLQVRQSASVPVFLFQVRTPDAPDPAWPTEGHVGIALAGVWIARTGPFEWTLVGPDAAAQVERASARLADALHHVAELTAGGIGFDLVGIGARALLAKGCPIDLHRRAFPDNAFAQTVFAQVSALLRRKGDDAFELRVEAGYAEHLRAWLRRASI